jgi:uncharacterized protein DUF4129
VVTAPPASATTWLTPGPAGGPPLIGRDAARALARRELAKPIYQQGTSLTERILEKIINFFGRLVQQVNTTVPGGWWALIVLGALAVIVIGVVLARLGPISLAHRVRRSAPLGDGVATARDHRERARELAAAGDWSGAIRESLRGIAKDLEERAILPPRPGRTADELAAEAARAMPGYGGGLWSAARLFDDVCYGERPGTAEGYARLRELDAAIRSARPLPLATVSAGDPA